MAVQQSKVSKSRVRMRKAANRYEGVQVSVCRNCGAACLPHRACKACGFYDGKQVLPIKTKKEEE